MIRRDEFHFSGQRKVEMQDSSIPPIAGPVINVAVGTDVPPRVGTIDLFELLVHKNRRVAGSSFQKGLMASVQMILLVKLGKLGAGCLRRGGCPGLRQPV